MKQFDRARLALASVFILLTMFAACKKDTVEEILGRITIEKVSNIPFNDTPWQHVFGGIAGVEYIRNSTEVIKDSLDLSQLATYQKTLELGTYDVKLTTKSTATADTFIRFSAELKGLVVDKGHAISLSATTTDGLVTISKDFVKDNTTPVFSTSDALAGSYKMGQANGFYFIYVKGGQAGKVSFISRETDDPISKELTVDKLNHYNLVVMTNGSSSISVVLEKFAYNEVPVSGNTLLTIPTSSMAARSVTEGGFIVSDGSGKIIDVTVHRTATSIKLVPTQRYNGERFSFLYILSPMLGKPHVFAYMNIKNGSHYSDAVTELPSKPYTFPLKVTLKNVPSDVSRMTFSTDLSGFNFTQLSDTTFFSSQSYAFSDDSKVLFQYEKGGNGFFRVFDIAKGTNQYQVDLAQVTQTAVSRNFTMPAPGQIVIWAKKDKNYRERYTLGSKVFSTASPVFFLPDETFEEYTTFFSYMLNDFRYIDQYISASIVETTQPLPVTFSLGGTTLAGLQPSIAGDFDHFRSRLVGPTFSIDVFAPSASRHMALKFPDFSSVAPFSGFDVSGLALDSFEVFDVDGFREDQLSAYVTIQTFFNRRGKVVYKQYN